MTAIGTREELIRVQTYLDKVFGVQDFSLIEAYLRIKIERDRGCKQVFISQPDYTRKILEENRMAGCCPVSMPILEKEKTVWKETTILLNDKEKSRYQAAIRSLLYLMHGSRPDIAYSVIKLSQYSSKPEQHY